MKISVCYIVEYVKTKEMEKEFSYRYVEQLSTSDRIASLEDFEIYLNPYTFLGNLYFRGKVREL